MNNCKGTTRFTWLVTASTVQISKTIMCKPEMRWAHIICFCTHCHASKQIMWIQWLQSDVLNSMQQSPSWKVNSCSASQNILHLFENLQLHFLVLTTAGARCFHSTLSNPIPLRPIIILTSTILACLHILRYIIHTVFKYAKERRILVSRNTTAYMC